MARERGVTYVKLDGDVGILGNGAGPRHVDARRRRAGAGGTPGQLPRRRRRRAGRGDRDRAGGAPLRHEGAGGALQRLRRHHPLRRGRPRHPRPRSSGSTSRVPIVVRLDGTNDDEGRRILADAAPPNVYVEATMLGAAAARRRARGSACLMPILVDAETRLVVQGITGREGSFHAAAQPRLRHRGRGRRDAGQGRARTSTASRSSTPSPTPSPSGTRTRRWCSCRRGSPPTRSTRRSTRASRTVVCITEGIPAHDMLRVYDYVRAARRDAARAELPGRALARHRQRRHHPGAGVRRRADRPRLALGHADVPDRQGAGRRWDSATRPSSASAATRSSALSFIDILERFEADPGTDLVVMVGEIGGDEEEKAAAFIAEHMQHAGGGLHRRLPGAARQDDGPRRRDHLRLVGHRRRPRRRRSRRAAVARRPQPHRGRRSWPRSALREARHRRRHPIAGCSHDRPIPFTRGVPSADLLPGRRPASRRRRGARRRPEPRALVVRARRLQAAARVDRRAPRRRRRPGADRERLAAGRRLPGPAPVRRAAAACGRRGAHLRPHADPCAAFGAELRAVPLDAERHRRRRARAELLAQRLRPRLLYVIPTFQNPSGVSLPERAPPPAGRAGARARRAGGRGRPLRPAAVRGRRRCRRCTSWTAASNVIYSLVVHQDGRAGRAHRLPGAARARWSKPLARSVGEHLDRPEHAGRGDRLARTAGAGRFEPNVARATAALHAASRRDGGGAARALPRGRRAGRRPSGGYFFWVDLPEQIDTAELLPRRSSAGVPYVSGADFSPRGRSSLRLAFSAVRARADQRGHRPAGRARSARRLTPAGRLADSGPRARSGGAGGGDAGPAIHGGRLQLGRAARPGAPVGGGTISPLTPAGTSDTVRGRSSAHRLVLRK